MKQPLSTPLTIDSTNYESLATLLSTFHFSLGKSVKDPMKVSIKHESWSKAKCAKLIYFYISEGLLALDGVQNRDNNIQVADTLGHISDFICEVPKCIFIDGNNRYMQSVTKQTHQNGIPYVGISLIKLPTMVDVITESKNKNAYPLEVVQVVDVEDGVIISQYPDRTYVLTSVTAPTQNLLKCKRYVKIGYRQYTLDGTVTDIKVAESHQCNTIVDESTYFCKHILICEHNHPLRISTSGNVTTIRIDNIKISRSIIDKDSVLAVNGGSKHAYLFTYNCKSEKQEVDLVINLDEPVTNIYSKCILLHRQQQFSASDLKGMLDGVINDLNKVYGSYYKTQDVICAQSDVDKILGRKITDVIEDSSEKIISHIVIYPSNATIPIINGCLDNTHIKISNLRCKEYVLVVQSGSKKATLYYYENKKRLEVDDYIKLPANVDNLSFTCVFEYGKAYKDAADMSATVNHIVAEVANLKHNGKAYFSYKILEDLTDEKPKTSCKGKHHPFSYSIQYDETLKDTLKSVYDDTMSIIADGGYVFNGSKVPLNLAHDSVSATRFYDKEIEKKSLPAAYETEIDVIAGDCLDVAHQMCKDVEDPSSVSVLNMAGRRRPGGRANLGGTTQEAYLFRCTDYARSLYQYDEKFAEEYGYAPSSEHKYELAPFYGGIFTPKATVFRASEENGYALIADPWKVNFIAASAIARPAETDYVFVHDFKKVVRTILRIALDNAQTNLVLGALGCGGMGNIPYTIATIFKEVLAEAEFLGVFQRIHFAILPSDVDTLTAFREVLVDGDVVYNADDLCYEETAKIANYFGDRKIKMSVEHYRELVKCIDNHRTFDTLSFDFCEHYNLEDILLFLAQQVQKDCHYDIQYLIDRKLHEEHMSERDLNELKEYYMFDAEENLTPDQHISYLQDEGFDEEFALLGYIRYHQDMKMYA